MRIDILWERVCVCVDSISGPHHRASPIMDSDVVPVKNLESWLLFALSV